jgi:ABC-type sugar transport system permease subunit
MLKITRNEKKAMPYLLPGLIFTLLAIVYPLAYILIASFCNNKIGDITFSGIKNYEVLFKNPQFKNAAINTLRLTLVVVTFSFTIGLVLAIVINRPRTRLKGLWRSIIFIAWIIPGIVKATAWQWIFQTENGILNHMLMAANIINKPVPWLTHPSYALWSVAVAEIWAFSPFIMVMLSAGLLQIPRDIYESAEIDGANGIVKLFRITIPILKDVCFICVLILFVWTINEFIYIWTMTSGGQNTTTLSILIYNQFKVLNINAASASAIMQLILTMVFAGIYVKVIGKED